ncbi:hypothetical protein ILUMI_04921 [Ignelater luminosus]|uniref:Uncharacterized protein n=1 Tax=Ignelater luminosus TaxID=2038154 RepID=A0A8K0D893_IGNLU|nr:hypothetical protein ILUMI_04921 [Ignelater luminosus]
MSVPASRRFKMLFNLQNAPSTSQSPGTVEDIIENDDTSSEKHDTVVDDNTSMAWKNVDGQNLNIGGQGPKAGIHKWMDTHTEEIKTGNIAKVVFLLAKKSII